MSDAEDPVAAALARGERWLAEYNASRDLLFEPMGAIYRLFGATALRACVAGVAEAVIIQERGAAQNGAVR